MKTSPHTSVSSPPPDPRRAKDIDLLNEISGVHDLNRAFDPIFAGFTDAETWPPQFRPKNDEAVRRLNLAVTELGGSLYSMVRNTYGTGFSDHVPATRETWVRLDALISQRGSADAKRVWAEAGGPAAAQGEKLPSSNVESVAKYLSKFLGGPDIAMLNPTRPRDVFRTAVNDVRADGDVVRARVGGFNNVSESQLRRAISALLSEAGLPATTIVFDPL